MYIKNILKNAPKTYSRCIKLLSNKFSSESENKTPLRRSLKDVEKMLNQSSPLDTNQNEANIFATTPYPNGTVFSQFTQASKSLRPRCDPRETSIVLFPGQGTQFVGMGKELMKYPVAVDMFSAASEILGYNLLKLCLEGPMSKLSETVYCQPAVVVSSLAAIERLKDENPEALNNCIATAGFSVGEITALIFAGCFTFERGIKIVKARAEAMQLCAEMTPGAMITVLLAADSKVNDAIKDAIAHCTKIGIEKPECVVSNYLYPSAKVLAGHQEAIDFIIKNGADYKIRKASKLKVSGAFHTRLMAPAADAITAALKKDLIKDPIIPVHRNIDGKRYRDAGDVFRKLPSQVYMPVKWEQIMHILYERPGDQDFPETFEVGPGNSLKTLLNKVNAKAALTSYNIYT